MKNIIAITFGILYFSITAITATNNTHSANITDIFVKLAKLIPENVDAEDLKKKIEEAFGSGSDMAEEQINQLKENGTTTNSTTTNSTMTNSTTTNADVKKSFFRDKWDKTKKFAKQTGHAVKEKMTSFGTYIKNKWHGKTPEVETNELNNVKKLAKEFLDDSKNLPKDVAEEGLEFFADLEKVLEDIKEKLNKTVNQ